MIGVDYAIIGVIAVSLLVGLIRGFLREVLSFVIWLTAIFIAWTFHRELAGELAHWITHPSVRLGVAFLILTFGVLILGAILNYLLYTLLKNKGFTGVDRALGMVFGGARGVILVAMLVFLWKEFTSLPQDGWWQESSLIGHFDVLAERILAGIPHHAKDSLKYL